jgi:tRNA G46 methylase TrmB
MAPSVRGASRAACHHLDDDFHLLPDCDHVYTVDLKIGIARGIFLADLAQRYPRSFFIGVELNAESAAVARERIADAKLDNARVVNAEAEQFIRDAIPTAAIDTIHIYHPTPYPGALRLDHRLISYEFEIEARRILRPWGALRLATDHGGYFRTATRVFKPSHWWHVPWQIAPIALERGCVVGSPLEQQHRSDGNTTVFTAQLLRVPG